MHLRMILLTTVVVGLAYGKPVKKIAVNTDSTPIEAVAPSPAPVALEESVPAPVPEVAPVIAPEPTPAPVVSAPEPTYAPAPEAPRSAPGFKGWVLTPGAWQVNLNPELINIATNPGTSVWAIEFGVLRKLQDKIWAGSRFTIPAGNFVGGGGFEIVGAYDAYSMGDVFSVQPNVGLGYVKETRFRKGSKSGQNYRWTQEQFLSAGVDLNSYWFSLNCRIGLTNGEVEYPRDKTNSGLGITYSLGLGLNYRF